MLHNIIRARRERQLERLASLSDLMSCNTVARQALSYHVENTALQSYLAIKTAHFCLPWSSTTTLQMQTSVPRPPRGTSGSIQQPSTQRKPAAAGGKSTYFSSYQLSRASPRALGHPSVCPAWPGHATALKPECRGTSVLGSPSLHRRALPSSWEILPTNHEHRA